MLGTTLSVGNQEVSNTEKSLLPMELTLQLEKYTMNKEKENVS